MESADGERRWRLRPVLDRRDAGSRGGAKRWFLFGWFGLLRWFIRHRSEELLLLAFGLVRQRLTGFLVDRGQHFLNGRKIFRVRRGGGALIGIAGRR